MPHGLSTLPMWWAGDLAIQAADVGQGNLRPDNLGLTVANVTGSSIPAGSLVYLNGWDTTVLAAGMPSIVLASASAQGLRAQWVTLAAIANNASGVVGQHFRLTGQNTNAATVGDPVYLNTTAGGYTLTTPPGAGVIYQIVGRVATKSATTGMIEFNLLSGSQAAALIRATGHLPSIGAAAGAYVGYAIATLPGTIVGGRAVFSTDLAVNGTNFVTFTAANLSNASASLLAASPANSTFTGGTAITHDVSYPLTLIATPANLVVGAGDLIKLTATITGTLGAAITGLNLFSFAVQPS